MSTDATGRRRFLSLVGWTTAAVGAGEALWASLRFARAPVSYGPPRRWSLGLPERYGAGATVFVEDAGVYVKRDAEGFRAMSAVCTHLGCTVRREGEGFVCPCHGSRYDQDGHVVGGPAPAPLAFYRIEKDRRGRLVVDLGRRVDPNRKLREA